MFRIIYHEDGRISQITFDPIEGAVSDNVIDGTGKYLIPGLFDAHFHLRYNPGKIRLKTEPCSSIIRLLKMHINFYLAFQLIRFSTLFRDGALTRSSSFFCRFSM